VIAIIAQLFYGTGKFAHDAWTYVRTICVTKKKYYHFAFEISQRTNVSIVIREFKVSAKAGVRDICRKKFRLDFTIAA
jgi:hypothetical protein